MASSAFDITLKVTQTFFDRKSVIDRISKARRKVLSKAGAFVRKRSRSLLRRRKKPSAAGQPPSVHSKDSVATLKNILFAYEEARDSVVIGPVKLNQVNDVDGGRMTVPELMEQGGVSKILEVSRNGGRTWRRFDQRRNVREGETFRRRSATYKPRPFMGPALAAEEDAIAAMWKDAV